MDAMIMNPRWGLRSCHDVLPLSHGVEVHDASSAPLCRWVRCCEVVVCVGLLDEVEGAAAASGGGTLARTPEGKGRGGGTRPACRVITAASASSTRDWTNITQSMAQIMQRTTRIVEVKGEGLMNRSGALPKS